MKTNVTGNHQQDNKVELIATSRSSQHSEGQHFRVHPSIARILIAKGKAYNPEDEIRKPVAPDKKAVAKAKAAIKTKPTSKPKSTAKKGAKK